MIEHDVRVKEANPHDIVFNRHDRRGRITGIDHSHHSGGYRAYCRTCGWEGEITGRSCEAHADAENHKESHYYTASS